MTQEQSIFHAMQKAAKAAAKEICNDFYKRRPSQEKSSHQDIVTKTDVKSQNILKKVLLTELTKLKIAQSDVSFICEEDTKFSELKTHTFIIDPLDGTTNFASGIRYFAVSIAYAYKGKIKLGFVVDPINKTVFWAQLGKGSWVKYQSRQPQKLRIKPTKQPKEWVLAVHYNALSVSDEQFRNYKKIYTHVRALRTPGCLIQEICEIAAGHIDGLLNGGTYIWDLAASKLILEESGGKVYDKTGKALKLDFYNPNKAYQPIACHPKYKARLFKLIE